MSLTLHDVDAFGLINPLSIFYGVNGSVLNGGSKF